MTSGADRRIIRGVRVATHEGIHPASVHLEEGKIVAVAGYDEVPRGCQPQELGKGLLIPGLIVRGTGSENDGFASGITTIISNAGGPCLRDFLARIWTEMRNRDQRLEELVALHCVASAEEAGLRDSKGQIASGMDADLCIWQPEWSLGRGSPELGLLYGQVRECIRGGHTRFRDGSFFDTNLQN